jgi:DNA-binding CsgD family transcriptional regulator/PAS domain-containing protein
MARSDSELLELVGRLHEGVVDPDMWKQGIDGFSGLAGSPFLLMGAITRGGRGVELEFGHGAASGAVSLLQGPLADPEHNPWLRLANTHALRRPATVGDLGGQDLLEKTRVWRELYLPFNIGDSVGVALERQPEFANILMLGRRADQPSFSPADLKALGAMLPHLARAWRVKRALAEMESKVGTLRFVLDRLDRAIVVAGPDGEVRFANRAANALLSRGDQLDARQGRLYAKRPQRTDKLLALIRGAAETGIGAGNVAVDALAIPSSDDNPPLAIVAEPLAPAHGGALGHAAEPGAILFIGDSEATNRPSAERLGVVYGLTPAEARLTALIVDGQGVASAAEALGVSPNTVKYHLKTVFGKVGVSRQAELVRRVLADVGGLAEPEKLVPSPSRPG